MQLLEIKVCDLLALLYMIGPTSSYGVFLNSNIFMQAAALLL
jgi:hypothetical protein